MLNKVLVYLQSDGIYNTSSYVWKTLRAQVYKKSVTYFLYLKTNVSPSIAPSLIFSGIQFICLKTIEEIEQYKFKRLQISNYKEWIKNGSVVYIGLIEGLPISFTWSHYNQYTIHDLETIKLQTNQCWIGPTFVDKRWRGKGINSAQIAHQITQEKKTTFLTSINEHNTPSIKSFEKANFKLGAKYSYYSLFKCQKRTKEFFNEGIQIIHFA